MRSRAAKKQAAWAAYPSAPRPSAIATSRRTSPRICVAAPGAANTSPQNIRAASAKRTASSVPTVAPLS